MASLPWFRMYAEAVDDEKLRMLDFSDRWHFVALLCCKCKGLFDTDDDWDKLQRKLALKLEVQVSDLPAIYQRLADEGLVDERMEPINWDKRQKSDDDSKERVRRHRQRKATQEETSDVTVCNGECNGERNGKSNKRSNASRARSRPGAESELDTERESSRRDACASAQAESSETAKDYVWRVGVDLLKSAGEKEPSARSFIGRLCKEHGDQAVRDAVGRAIAVAPAEPKAWLRGALKNGAEQQEPFMGDIL